MTNILPISQDSAILAASIAIGRGDLIVIPTDTVYGVACSPFDEEAITRLYAAKQRAPEKALPVLLADPGDALRVATSFPPLAARLIARFWPGALTITLPKRDGLPPNLSAYDSIGVRVPDHIALRSLIRAAGGALAVSSANISGMASPTNVQQAAAMLGDCVAVYLDGGTMPGSLASTVVEAHGSDVKIVREGPVTRAMIQAALAE
jgi:L-threonylcarbamoyladenylate synthase